jgi:hypothetical protein
MSFKHNMENLTIQMDLNNTTMWRGLMFLLKKNVMLKKLPM